MRTRAGPPSTWGRPASAAARGQNATRDASDTYASLFSATGRAAVPRGVRPRLDPDWQEERALWDRGYRFVAGIDEVGRGCIAGPVVAGAVVLPRDWAPAGLRDSKLLDAPTREELAAEIRSRAVAWAVAAVEADVIDRINILRATLLAGTLAAARLAVRPDALLLDAIDLPGIGVPQRTLVDADRLCRSVAAASVVAKVHRDRLMAEHDASYPGYGFLSHKGYTCPEHRAAIGRLGLTPLHRRSFAPCGGMTQATEADSMPLWIEGDG